MNMAQRIPLTTAMPEYDNLRLDNQLCFALYAATHAVTRAYRPGLGDVSLTYPQYLVMLVLWEHGAQSVRDLGRRLLLDSGTLTPLLKRLEKSGFVARHRCPDDERVVIVDVTDTGHALRHEVARVQASVACRSGLSRSEFLELRDTLRRLTEAMTVRRETLPETD